jgi:hypothetical protein
MLLGKQGPMASYDRYIGVFAVQKKKMSQGAYPEAKGETPIRRGCSQTRKIT